MSTIPKPIITNTPADIGATNSEVKFIKNKFNELVYDKGIDVWVDKAIRCPCVVESTGQALPGCKNCLSVGWVFVNRKVTRLVVQGIKANVKYEQWSQTTTGFAKVTARAIDRLCFMDRIILQEAEGIFQEVLKPKLWSGAIIAYPNYLPLEILDIYRFDTKDTKLIPLLEGAGNDYQIVDNSLVFNNSFTSMVTSDPTTLSVTIRYVHNITYHVVDMNRDVMMTKVRACKVGEESGEMPVMGLLRKAHYLFDNLKFDRDTLLENSVTP